MPRAGWSPMSTSTAIPGKSITDAIGDASLAQGEAQDWRSEKRCCIACGREFTPIRRAQKICCGGKGRTRLWRKRRELRAEKGGA